MTAEVVDGAGANARISRTIRSLIAAREINTKILADQVGMTDDTLGRRLKHGGWRADEILAIASAFEVSVSVILESNPDDWFRRDPAAPPTPVVTLRKKSVPTRPGKARTRRNSVYNSAGSSLVAA